MSSRGAACAAGLAMLLVPAGVDLRITDTTGTQVTVLGAVVDYGGFFSLDRETNGIRVLQGDGIALLEWANVDTLRVMRVDSANPPRVELEIALRSGRRVPAALFTKGKMKLTGRSDLGEYEIDLQRIRTIVPLHGVGPRKGLAHPNLHFKQFSPRR